MPNSDNYLSNHPIFKYKNRNISVSLVRKYRYDIEEVAPIFWRITHNRKLKVYFSGFEFSKKEWDEFVNRDLRKHAGTKQTLLRFLTLTLKPAIDTLAETNDFSFAGLDNLLTDQPTSTVNEAFQKKIVSLENEYKIGNASIYRTTLNALMRFKHYKLYKRSADKTDFINRCIESKYVAIGKKALSISEKISFEEITPEFLIECEKFWLDTGVAHATIGIYMRTLRAIINNNEGEEPYISQKRYPFGVKRGKYAIPEGGRKIQALELEEIWKIEDFETDIDSLKLACDVIVFMFYGNGMNFGDFCRLRYENIDAASREIIFQRKKTFRDGEKPTFIYVPLLPPMIEIINRQGNKNQDGYIFPFLNGIEPTRKNEKKIKETINLALAPINSSLKTIATKLELDPELSTSYTRNSYITHLTTEKYINPIVVKKMVGHSTKKDVTAGYVNLTPKKRREINSKLLNPNKKYTMINSGKAVEVG